MKKVMFVVMAACAIGFTSCGNKAQQQAPADETEVQAEAEVQDVDVESTFNESAAQLSEQIEAHDAGKLATVLEAVKAKIAEILKQNPEAAKEYVTKIQNFLKENADKIKAFAGDNAAVQTVVNALTSAPAETVVDGLMQAVEGVKATGEEAIDAAKEAGQDAVDAAKQAGQDAVDAAKEKANEQIDKAANEAADKAKKALGL